MYNKILYYYLFKGEVMLPNYLSYKTNAKPNFESVVESGYCRFTVITSRLLRIEYGEFTDKASLAVICRDFEKTDFEKTQENGLLKIKTEFLELSYKIGKPLSKDSLKIKLLNGSNTVWNYGDSPKNNLGGTVTTLDNVDGACELGDGVCSLDGYALLDDSKTPLFDEEGWFEGRKDTTDLYFFGYGNDYTNCVKDYYRLTGTPEMLPSFAFGNWWSRYYKYTEQSYIELMERFKSEDIPISVGIVDMDWHLTDGDGRDYRTDGWTGYTWNKDYFPDYKRFIEKLHQNNIKTALNLHPQSGIRHWEDQYERVAEIMGVNPETKAVIPFNFVDKKLWKAYFEELLFPYEKDGVDFWWMDWQEQFDYYKPVGDKLECMSPLWMLNHFHYLTAGRKGERPMIFSRFAGFGSQRYPIGFSGDTIITWESLDFQPYFTVTASNVGYSFWSHDIGGHMGGYRDDELTTRWIQFGVFSPIFRLHSTDNIFTGREPWGYGKNAEIIIKDFMRLRHKMFPYIYTMGYRNYKELLPLMRPMYHTNPQEKESYEVPNQYWFGSEMIVAPITKKADSVSGLGKVEVWLPEGKWIDLFTGDIYNGNRKYTVYRPLNKMPVFCKAGAIVPMQKHIENDNHLGLAKTLEITVCAGNNGNFTLYEDDGKSMGYKTGDYCTTEFDFDISSAVFKKNKSLGNLKLVPQNRDYILTFKGFAKGLKFFVNGNEITAEYDKLTNTYTLNEINCDSDDEFEIAISLSGEMLASNDCVLEKAIDILSCSQCKFEDKDLWLKKFNKAINSKQPDLSEFENDDNYIGGALSEQIILKGEV